MIKIYDERDLDFYNPKPYMQKLMSFLDREDINHISWYLDNDRFDYLFTWPSDVVGERRESKRYRVFVDNVLDVLKLEHQQTFFDRIISKVQDFENRFDSLIQLEEHKIKEHEDAILNARKHIEEKKANLDRLHAIRKEYSKP
jgi:hypothetical protein